MLPRTSKHRTRPELLFAVFVALSGCESSSSTSNVAPASSSADAASSTASTIDAGGAASVAPKDSASLVDLLQATESEIAVSSNVDNPRDFPEHLVDGKPETAWNGKTGDLHGSITFKVPDDSHVTRILLTPGFDKKNAEGDLFTMNHRIKKIRVTRNGELVGDQSLDTSRRTLQPMTIDKAGGTYKIEVLETEPGTKKTWQELCVSELRVLGTVGKTGVRKTPRIPDVKVGALGAPRPEPQPHDVPNLAAAFAKPEEFCKAFRTRYTPINAARTDYPGPVETTCAASDDPTAVLPKIGVTVAPFVDALAYGATDDQSTFTAIAFHTTKGWFYAGPHLADDALGDPHCGGYGEYLGDAKAAFATTSRGASALVTWHYGYENHGPMLDETTGLPKGTFASSNITFEAVTCVATDTRVTCDKVVDVEQHQEDEPLSIARNWRSRAKVSLKPDGTIAVDH